MATESGWHPGKPSEQSVSKRGQWSGVKLAAERATKVRLEKWTWLQEVIGDSDKWGEKVEPATLRNSFRMFFWKHNNGAEAPGAWWSQESRPLLPLSPPFFILPSSSYFFLLPPLSPLPSPILLLIFLLVNEKYENKWLLKNQFVGSDNDIPTAMYVSWNIARGKLGTINTIIPSIHYLYMFNVTWVAYNKANL